jgi:hypothetical protein
VLGAREQNYFNFIHTWLPSKYLHTYLAVIMHTKAMNQVENIPGGVPTLRACLPCLRGSRESAHPSSSVRSPPGRIPSLNITCFGSPRFLELPAHTFNIKKK